MNFSVDNAVWNEAKKKEESILFAGYLTKFLRNNIPRHTALLGRVSAESVF